jgi:hypothetical protein
VADQIYKVTRGKATSSQTDVTYIVLILTKERKIDPKKDSI